MSSAIQVTMSTITDESASSMRPAVMRRSWPSPVANIQSAWKKRS